MVLQGFFKGIIYQPINENLLKTLRKVFHQNPLRFYKGFTRVFLQRFSRKTPPGFHIQASRKTPVIPLGKPLAFTVYVSTGMVYNVNGT